MWSVGIPRQKNLNILILLSDKTYIYIYLSKAIVPHFCQGACAPILVLNFQDMRFFLNFFA